jgi:hypothetical protein
MRLAFFLSLFICPKDTARCGEASSPHDVIEVVIVGEKTLLQEVAFFSKRQRRGVNKK